MVTCCRCNKFGQCKGCASVKAGKNCSKCLPSSLGTCTNAPPTTKLKTATATLAHMKSVDGTPDPSPSAINQGTNQNADSENDSNTSQWNFSCSTPPYLPLAEPNFSLDPTDAPSFCKSLREAYNEVIHGKKNCFQIPLSNIRQLFTTELARLYKAYASGSALEFIAFMVTTVLPILL